VYKDDLVVAFLDFSPITPGHTLVVPVREVVSFTELDEETGGRILRVSGLIARAVMQSELRAHGVNLLLSDGEKAGQDVPHAHLHVVPRYPNDGFSWVLPDQVGLQSRKQLDQTARLMRAWLTGSDDAI
jgi:diadenosine tetraphosphate (Ap4A) HIT family hydrolase